MTKELNKQETGAKEGKTGRQDVCGRQVSETARLAAGKIMSKIDSKTCQILRGASKADGQHKQAR